MSCRAMFFVSRGTLTCGARWVLSRVPGSSRSSSQNRSPANSGRYARRGATPIQGSGLAMRLAIFVDQVFWREGDTLSTDEPYILFPASFIESVDEIIFIGREAR